MVADWLVGPRFDCVENTGCCCSLVLLGIYLLFFSSSSSFIPSSLAFVSPCTVLQNMEIMESENAKIEMIENIELSENMEIIDVTIKGINDNL